MPKHFVKVTPLILHSNISQVIHTISTITRHITRITPAMLLRQLAPYLPKLRHMLTQSAALTSVKRKQ